MGDCGLDTVEKTLTSTRLAFGLGRITNNLGTFVTDVDESMNIPDEESVEMVYDILDTEGLCLGANSALNVVAAYKLAQKLGPGKTIATSLCDSAYRYHSRLFSKKWLEAEGSTGAILEHLKKYAALDQL